VSGSIRLHFGHFGVVTVLGLVCVVIDARPARAQGCHGPERPTLGFSTTAAADPFDLASWLSPPDQRQVQVIPRPCSGDLAHASVLDSAFAATALTPGPIRAIEPTSDWICAPDASTRPLDRPSRIDRPPRLVRAAV
jgi:hypothetical protein